MDDIEVFAKQEKMLKLYGELRAAEEERVVGKQGYSIGDLDKKLNCAITEINNEKIR